MSAWAKRKAAVQAEAEALESAERAAGIAEQQAALATKPEAEVLAELELPNPDDMQAGDDFSAFMKETVPAALRNRALRTLWRSDPALANVDMLVDYGEDFTGASDPVGLVKTIYRVGKGMLPDEEDSEVEDVTATPAEAVVETVEIEAQAPSPPPAPAPEATTPPTPRRRIRFEFEDSPLLASTETDLL